MVFVAWATWHDIGNAENTPCLDRWIKEDNDAHHTQDNQTNFHHHRATHLHISKWCMFGWGIRFDVMMSINIFWYEGCWHVMCWGSLGSWSRQRTSGCNAAPLASQTSESSLVPIALEVSPPQRRLLHQLKGGLCPWHIFLAFHQSTFALRPGPPGLVSSTGLPAMVLLPLLELMYIVTHNPLYPMSGIGLGVQVKVQKLRIFTFYTIKQRLLGPSNKVLILHPNCSPQPHADLQSSHLKTLSPFTGITSDQTHPFCMIWENWRICHRSNELSGRLRIISKSHWIPSREFTYPPDFRHIWVDDFPNFPRWDMFSFPGGYIESMFHPFSPHLSWNSSMMDAKVPSQSVWGLSQDGANIDLGSKWFLVHMSQSRWWFPNIFYFHPENWGNDPIWLIFFKGVETTN